MSAIDWTQVGKLIEVVHDQRVRQHTTGTTNWAAAVCKLMSEAAPQPAQQAVAKDRIREIFLTAGFTIKEGQTDLKQYVYDAAYALLNEAPQPAHVEENRKSAELNKAAIDQLLKKVSPQPAQPHPAEAQRDRLLAAIAEAQAGASWPTGSALFAGPIAVAVEQVGKEIAGIAQSETAKPTPHYEPTDEGIGND